jgi:hypothetical protein
MRARQAFREGWKAVEIRAEAGDEVGQTRISRT